MTPELWKKLGPLFNEVIDRPSSQRRAAVAEVCGDDAELERELLKLVNAHEQQEEATHDLSEVTRNVISGAALTFRIGECLLGRFTIVRRLGGGGMGEVFEAFDSELSQSIALKIVRPEIARNDSSLARFRKEVQLARRIVGPNVCRIYEFFVLESANGAPGGAFLTMELLEGINLADRLAEGPVSVGQTGQIASDICRAISDIHETGIIHRDLKTRNIMLVDRGGRNTAVVTDFGLARELLSREQSAATELTLQGSILGTPEYMAPEQFEAGEITPAADIYALGIVLYELATGKHPYASSNPLGAAVRRARRLEPASSLNPSVPRQWDRVITRCLEYDPSLRFQTAAEVARALDRRPFGIPQAARMTPARKLLLGLALAVPVVLVALSRPLIESARGMFSPREKHIAVLPFDLKGEAEELAIVGDGLMEAFTGKLANLDRANKNLWVVPASEVRRRGVGDPGAALREFGATIVVRGHFSRLPHGLRLTLELIDVRKMREIGYADIDRPDEDLAALQDEGVQRLGRLMNISVDKSARDDEAGASGSSYNDYVQALGYLERYDKPGYLDDALRTLDSAVKASPRFAPGLAALCRAYSLKFEIDSNTDSLEPARGYCGRAIALNDSLPEAHAIFAKLNKIEGHYDLAAQEFNRIIELDPQNVDALSGLAEFNWNAGNLKDAEKYYMRAIDARKQDWQGYNNLGIFYDRIGRHREAIESYEHALDLTPDNAAVDSNLGAVYVNSSDPSLYPQAERLLRRSIDFNPTFDAYTNLGNLYMLEKRYPESAQASEKALTMNTKNYTVWNNLLEVCEQLGNHARAAEARKQIRNLAEAAIRLNEKNADAHSMLALALAKEKERESALAHIRTALALEPEDQSVLAQVAEAYESLGQRDSAIRCLKLAIRKGFPRSQIIGDASLEHIAADPHFRS